MSGLLPLRLVRRAADQIREARETVLFAPTAAPATGCDQICFVGVACCCGGEFIGCYDSEAECPGACGAQVLETEQTSELAPLFAEPRLSKTTEPASTCPPPEASLP